MQPGNVRKTANKASSHDDDSHMALENGGYDDVDDFDYDAYLKEDFPDKTAQKSQVKGWIWITAWVLIFATLLPYLYYAVILAK